MKKVLRIGEFSKLTGVSIHMLRNYDKTGLLVPTEVDCKTGYRYYNEAQIIVANQIQVLKRLGFGLKEIQSIQHDLGSNKELKMIIEEKLEEKIKEREAINKQIKELRKAIYEIEEEQVALALEVNIKTFPARKVVSLRGIIHAFQEEGRLWGELMQICMKHHIPFGEAEYSFAITHDLDLKNSIMDVEVQSIVDKKYPEIEGIRFKEIPECQVASVVFKGEYTQIGKLNAYMGKWIKEHGYMLQDLPFTTYYRSPGNEQNPSHFITELCFPIGKRVI